MTHSADAFNDDDIGISNAEGTIDATIVDLVLQDTGRFFIQIETSDAGDSFDNAGDYELFFTRFNGAFAAVPEPSAAGLLMILWAGCGLVRRRRI